ncbi:Protein MTO1, mitochondrial [Gossypium arboreum]|uniref:Protein MTO1, mitochondrial n=1 Tax=Gossypium arboreum TaxID=29729 RepID=A0A0B0P2D0_GOSAR|nr:Protein MTO1, mitochondrial [Gossypium arboreum]KHG21424.1 Protein MTO1, mitochondrial [Gossypium arboreum]
MNKRTRQDVLSTKAVKEEKTPFAKVENEMLVQVHAAHEAAVISSDEVAQMLQGCLAAISPDKVLIMLGYGRRLAYDDDSQSKSYVEVKGQSLIFWIFQLPNC